MLIDFIFLSIASASSVLYSFLIRKEYKKVVALYSFSLVTIFYTPSLYFFFGGEGYRFFSNESLVEYFHFGTYIFIIYLFLGIVINNLRIKATTFFGYETPLLKLYFLTLSIPIIIYYIVYFKEFPLVHFISTGDVIDRPDLTGHIPHFITVSTLVQFIFPSIYFFYFNKISSKSFHIIINLAIAFFFLASGNKGFITYYVIFLWLYVFQAKFDLKLVLSFVIVMLMYMLSKGITELNSDTLTYMTNSPFRRFFVAQGTGHIYRVDMLNEGYNYLNADPRGIKFDAFSRMYNTYIVGSAPTFYTGDILLKYGKMFSLVVFTIISTIIIFASRHLQSLKTNQKLYIYWNLYAILFFLVMSEIDTNKIIRLSVGIINIYALVILSKSHFKNTSQ